MNVSGLQTSGELSEKQRMMNMKHRTAQTAHPPVLTQVCSGPLQQRPCAVTDQTGCRAGRSATGSGDCLRLLAALLVTLCAAPRVTFAQSADQQLKVVEQIWGFDGRVQPGQFNPLSILLDNQTDDPIDATATLQRIQGMLTPTGGLYAQKILIAPTARRWIQFYPYAVAWSLRLRI